MTASGGNLIEIRGLRFQRGELRTLAVSLLGQPRCIDTVAMKKRPA